MAQTGGEIAAKRSKPSDDGADTGEDRLSALPDDVLVLILLRLDGSAAAIRTSILSRRWRRVWALLPELRFDLVPDGQRIRDILHAPEAPELRCISITTKGAGPESAAAWLPVAARRLIGSLVYSNVVPGNDEDDDEEDGAAGDRGEVQLPCFEKATMIVLDLGLVGLVMPSPGVFTRITKLKLSRVWFRGPCNLGNVVSSPRCPCLQRLKVSESWGLQNLSIHSESLVRIKLENLHLLRHVTIVAPKLLRLDMDFNFFDDDPSEPVVNISASQLVSLVWRDAYDSRYVHLGNLGRVRRLSSFFIVYGDQDNRDHNHHSLRLLQRFQILHGLNMTLIYGKDIYGFQYLMEDMTMLPQVTLLYLSVVNEGHAFGASLFHLLRMCTGLRKLVLILYDNRNSEAQSTCPPDCICDEPTSWKTEGLFLNHLESATFFDLQGSDHEVTFLKQLFNWATVLKNMTIRFGNHITESKAREFRQSLVDYSRPETSVKFYLSHAAADEMKSVCLLSPEGQGTGC